MSRLFSLQLYKGKTRQPDSYNYENAIIKQLHGKNNIGAFLWYKYQNYGLSQPAFTCSESSMETPEQFAKSVQS